MAVFRIDAGSQRGAQPRSSVDSKNAETLDYLARALHFHPANSGRQAAVVRPVAVIDSGVPRVDEKATEG